MSVSDYECLIPAQPRGQPTVGGPPSSTLQLTKYTKTIKAQTKATTITNLPAQPRGQPTVGGLSTLPTRSHNQICDILEDCQKHTHNVNRTRENTNKGNCNYKSTCSVPRTTSHRLASQPYQPYQPYRPNIYNTCGLWTAIKQQVTRQRQL